ncbi:MAG: ACT domain-containing protein [Oscillospiraceae bacterium]|jgi:acetolactate synthase-1/3 small subunit|nr:ACT domain-containing protein [Oscillospiraceae bacterium]
MDSTQRSTFRILVANRYGVLTKVAAAFARRACNIIFLEVHALADDPSRSVITAVAEDSRDTIRQVYNQLFKLEDVIELNID